MNDVFVVKNDNLTTLIMRTVSEHSQAQTAYEPTLWAKVFHSVPHVNITFHSVNSQFNPENDLYLESLGILASIPAAWLITTLVRIVGIIDTGCLLLGCKNQPGKCSGNTKKRRAGGCLGAKAKPTRVQCYEIICLV